MKKYVKIKNPNSSMRGRFAVYIISVILIFISVIILLFGLFGILNPANKQISDNLDTLLSRHTEAIENDTDELAACAISLAGQLESDLQSFLSENNLLFEDLENNKEALDKLQLEMYTTLYLNMQVAHPSGAFLMLDTSVSSPSETQYYNGIYLKYINLFSDNTVNNDFSIFRGSFSTGHKNSITFHSGWKNECRTDFFEKSEELFPDGVHYILSPAVEIPDTWETARYVYVPIRDIKGKIVGVCGFEINDLLFRLSHKPDVSELGFVVCGLLDNKENISGQFNSNRYGITDNFSYTKKGSLIQFDFENESCIGKTDSISLGNDSFTIAVMMPKNAYDMLLKKEQLKFVSIFLIIAILALCCSIYMSKKYISPIVRRIEQIKSAQKLDNSLKISEIDDLFDYLEQRDLLAEERLRQLEEDKHSAEIEAEKSRQAYEAALKECELAQIEIQRLSESTQAEINADEYDYFISNLGTLTETERKVYELYLDGKKAGEISEILGIKPNTIKFHNKNIYSKLGISSRKQLLKYAIIKQYQDSKSNKES